MNRIQGPGIVASGVMLAFALPLARVCAASAGAVETRSCFIPRFEAAVRCVSLRVPIEWDHPERGSIRVAAAVVPALGGGGALAPLLVLPGGPGQAGTDLGPLVDAAFSGARDNREIILFDPRGTGRSTRLRCAFDTSIRPFNPASVAESGKRCHEHAAAFGDEPALRAVAQDIDALREALGIRRMDVWGGSYGTKYAQAYARLYPSRVRSMVLDGAVAAGESILSFAASDADRAWSLLVRDCRADASCRAAYPRLEEQTTVLLRKAAASPIRAHIANPINGGEREVAFDRTALSNVIRGALYVPQYAALVPLAVQRAASGDLAPLAALNSAGAAWSTDTMSLGATAGVMCSEEAPLARSAPSVPGRLIGNSYADYWLALCRDWPTRGPTFRTPAAHPLDMPVLLLVGALDPIAPFERALSVARSFRDARILVAPAGGHTISTLGCVPRLIAQFLDDGSARRLDTACLRTPRKRPPFAVDGTDLRRSA